MLHLIIRPIKLLLFAVVLAQCLATHTNAGLIPNSWMESLVLIEVQKKGDFEPLGTGFMIGSKGYKILFTNAHVLRSNTGGLPLFIRVNKKTVFFRSRDNYCRCRFKR